MSKIIPATCDATGKVSAFGAEVPEAIVLSLGTKASDGLLFIDGPKAWYFPSSATDIKDAIISLVQIIEQIKLVLTGLDAGAPSPGTNAAAIAALEVLKLQFDQTKETLK